MWIRIISLAGAILLQHISACPHTIYAGGPEFFPPQQPEGEQHALAPRKSVPAPHAGSGPLQEQQTMWVAHQPGGLPLRIELVPSYPSRGVFSESEIHRLTPAEMPLTTPLSALGDYNYGIALLTEGRLNRAMAEWESAIRKAPHFAEAHYALGRGYLAVGNTVKARKEFESTVTMKPEWAEAHAQLGLAAYLLHDIDTAETELLEAIRLEPEQVSPYVNLGLVGFLKDNRAAAISNFHTALDHDPVLPEAHFNVGVVLASRGEWRKALAHVEQAQQLMPTLRQLPRLLGVIYQARGDWARSLTSWRKAVLAEPDSAALHERVAETLFQTGNWAEAVSEFERVLELHPLNAQASFHLGVVQQARGHHSAAITAFRKASELDTTWAQPLINWGKALSDRPHEAVTLYQQAIQRDEDCADAYHLLGLTYALLGQEHNMVSAFREAADRGLIAAQADLGTAYFTGSGVPRQIGEAMHWWFKAARQGSSDAQHHLSNLRRTVFMRKSSSQEVEDTKEGFARLRREWTQENADQGGTGRASLSFLLQQAWLLDDGASSILERIYQEGMPPHVSRFDPRILEYFQRTAEEGRLQSCKFLRNIDREGWGAPRDRQKSRAWQHDCDS